MCEHVSEYIKQSCHARPRNAVLCDHISVPDSSLANETDQRGSEVTTVSLREIEAFASTKLSVKASKYSCRSRNGFPRANLGFCDGSRSGFSRAELSSCDGSAHTESIFRVGFLPSEVL